MTARAFRRLFKDSPKRDDLLHWRPSRELAWVVALNLLVFLLGVTEIYAPATRWLFSWVIKNFLIFFCVPAIYYLRASSSPSNFGFGLPDGRGFIRIAFANALLFAILPPPGLLENHGAFPGPLRVNILLFYATVHLAELLFFYLYTQRVLRKAFGLAPAILLSSLFYSLFLVSEHDLNLSDLLLWLFRGGFQALAFELGGRHILALWPFIFTVSYFWSWEMVGSVFPGDYPFELRDVSRNTTIPTLAAYALVMVLIFLWKRRAKTRRDE